MNIKGILHDVSGLSYKKYSLSNWVNVQLVQPGFEDMLWTTAEAKSIKSVGLKFFSGPTAYIVQHYCLVTKVQIILFLGGFDKYTTRTSYFPCISTFVWKNE